MPGTVHRPLELAGPSTGEISPTTSASLNLGQMAPGEYELYCEIPGHKEAGMTATLTVVDPSQAGDINISATRTETVPDWAALDAAMQDSMKLFPATTQGKGNEIIDPVVLADGTKEFSLRVAITPWEVEPGKFVDA